jgi:hypothetical protein
MIPTNAIVIRHASESEYDRQVLTDLASLDSREPLDGRALIAEVDGVPRAALDLDDGSIAADPFVQTAELVEMLRVRAGAPTGLRAALHARIAARRGRPRAAAAGATARA